MLGAATARKTGSAVSSVKKPEEMQKNWAWVMKLQAGGQDEAVGVVALAEAIEAALRADLGIEPAAADAAAWQRATAIALRRKVMVPWLAAEAQALGKRRIAYLSMEFLVGRILGDCALNLGLYETLGMALDRLGVPMTAVIGEEPDPALGNGGLGRLAACFLDSLSTLGVAATGYGLRYEYGLFRQGFAGGQQVESPDDWLKTPSPWLVERPSASYLVGFGGHVGFRNGAPYWEPGEHVSAEAHDLPVVGFGGKWVNPLRLWQARAPQPFDLPQFSRGDHLGASEAELNARKLCRVLYPDDETQAGKELRLKQEYFLCAAAVQDILARHYAAGGRLETLHKSFAIQMNDTHPAIVAPELVRVLTDRTGMGFDQAMRITTATLGYTNHTLMPEALEAWSTWTMGTVLPRHMQIIEQIDSWHEKQHPKRPVSTKIVAFDTVRMGNLAFIAAHKVNGVSALHSDLVRSTVFADMEALHPGRILNETNGVTPRRWIALANPPLARLLTDELGEGWQTDLDRLSGLEARVEDAGFLDHLGQVKAQAKARMGALLAPQGVVLNPEALVDVQVKRIHEYKRQFLNLLEAIALWQDLREGRASGAVPRVKIFGGKAAPGYHMAKSIIRLIHDVADVVNRDPKTRDMLQIIYPANYNVSMAEVLIPAADLSEQISTAGTEASGTGNMKFGLNGALTIGTLDGANVEMREKVGPENFFLFGMTTPEARACLATPGHARSAIEASPRLQEVLQLIAENRFSPADPGRHSGILDMIWNHDPYACASDFESYYAQQREVDSLYAKPLLWRKKAALNIARLGFFSSDRTIRGYMEDIWNVTPLI